MATVQRNIRENPGERENILYPYTIQRGWYSDQAELNLLLTRICNLMFDYTIVKSIKAQSP